MPESVQEAIARGGSGGDGEVDIEGGGIAGVGAACEGHEGGAGLFTREDVARALVVEFARGGVRNRGQKEAQAFGPCLFFN